MYLLFILAIYHGTQYDFEIKKRFHAQKLPTRIAPISEMFYVAQIQANPSETDIHLPRSGIKLVTASSRNAKIVAPAGGV